jgi:hypothetical protein
MIGVDSSSALANFSDFEPVVSTAEELLSQPDTKEKWEQKRVEFLSDKCNLTALIVDLVERVDTTGSVETAVSENADLTHREGSMLSTL